MLAEETGGIAVVNQNDFNKALKRIDAETSDYYVLGYYSKNPDATKRRRQVEVKIARKGAQPWFRKEYVLKPPPKPVVVDEEVAASRSVAAVRRSGRRLRPSRLAAPRQLRLPRRRASRVDRLVQVGLVDVRADEIHAEPRAGDRRAAQARERIHRHLESATSPCSRRHCSGSRDGNVAGCGRSRSRRWIVSYGMNQVLPRQRTPPGAPRQRAMFD